MSRPNVTLPQEQRIDISEYTCLTQNKIVIGKHDDFVEKHQTRNQEGLGSNHTLAMFVLEQNTSIMEMKAFSGKSDMLENFLIGILRN